MRHPMNRFSLSSTVVGVVILTVRLFAQSDPVADRLGLAFEATVAAHVDGARLDRTSRDHDRSRQRRWELGGSEMYVAYSVEASEKEAAAMFRYRTEMVQIPILPLRGFGDASYWAPHSDPAGGSMLYCRRGRVVLVVYAPAPDDRVQRVSRLFLAEVEKELAKEGGER